MKYFKQILANTMWILLIIFPPYSVLIQLIFKPVSYPRFLFVFSIFMVAVLPISFFTDIRTVNHSLLVSLAGVLRID